MYSKVLTKISISFLQFEKQYNKGFFKKRDCFMWLKKVLKVKKKKILLALRRFHLFLSLWSNATNFICNVPSLSLEGRLQKNSEEGRCPLFAHNLINFSLFCALLSPTPAWRAGANKRGIQGQKTIVNRTPKSKLRLCWVCSVSCGFLFPMINNSHSSWT